MNIKRAEMVPPEDPKHPSFELSDEAATLTEYFKTKKPGDELFWSDIERETGLPMGAHLDDGKKNRSLCGRAILRAGHRQGHLSIRGHGLLIIGPANALAKSENRRRSIRSLAKKALREGTEALKLELQPHVRAQLDFRIIMMGTLVGITTPKAIEAKTEKATQPMLPLE